MKRKIKILLIEDDEEDYLITKDVIDDIPGNKYELVWSSSYQAGLQEIKEDGYDIYLVDYRLGKESGLDLLREISSKERDTPFILLTGVNDLELDLEAMEAGAADFLVKGQIAPDSLDRSIRYAIKLSETLKRLKQSEASLEEAQSIARIGSWVWIPSTNEIFWSDEHYRIFGLEPQGEKVNFKWFLQFVLKEDQSIIKDIYQHFANGLDSADFEYRIRLPNKEIKFIHVIARAENDENNELVRIKGASQDVTELREATRNLELLNKKLEEKVNIRTADLRKSEQKLRDALKNQMELNELKSRFVSMASHEFRTPLSSILSSVSLIRRYSEKGIVEKQGKHIERIQNSVKNLTTILNDFLSLEKLESGKVELKTSELDFTEFVAEISEELSPTLKEGQHIIHNHEGENNLVLDTHLVKNILFNLLSNAIKYSPNGENITINSKVENRNLTFDIIDKGIGIPEEDQKHMFSRFFRATNVSNIKGTGLGLIIVLRYVNLMNGTISFVSEQGKGTCFTVYIPDV